MTEQARTEMGVETLDAVDDRSYYTSEEILVCEESGITVTPPKPLTSGASERSLRQARLCLCRSG